MSLRGGFYLRPDEEVPVSERGVAGEYSIGSMEIDVPLQNRAGGGVFFWPSRVLFFKRGGLE